MEASKGSVPLVGQVRPQQLGVEDVAKSGWLDVSQFQKVMAAAIAGAVDSATATLSWEQATTNDNPAGGDLKALTAWTGGVLDAAGEALQVENDVSKLDINGGFRFVRALLTSNDGGEPTVGLLMFGVNPRYVDVAVAAGNEVAGAGPAP